MDAQCDKLATVKLIDNTRRSPCRGEEAENRPRSEFGTKFEREVTLILEIPNSLKIECTTSRGSLCAENQLDLFSHFDRTLACDRQTDRHQAIALCACVEYASRGKKYMRDRVTE